MKKSWLILILFLVSLSCITGQKPNIIVIFSDDHALQAISAYGSPHIKTPNIDRIAREGAIFKNAFCTNSICGPSRAVLLTGKYNHLNGQIDNKTTTIMDTRQPSFPMYLQRQGYTTSWIGKWHINNTPRFFDYWKVLPGQGNYYNPDFIQMDSSIVRMPGYATELITDEALGWLDKNAKNAKPFCLVIGHKAPHREWQPDTRDLHAFEDSTGMEKPFKVPATFFDSYDKRYAAAHQLMEIKDMRWDWDSKVKMKGLPIYERMSETQKADWDEYYEKENKKLDTVMMTSKEKALWKYQRYMHDYLGCILSLDRNIGRVLDYLDKNDLVKNTIVIYSSDQGFYLGEHGWFDKRFMYEPSLHMPLMIRYPSLISPGTIINKSVVNIDYAPTILDFAGVTIPKDMQGKSIKPLLTNPKLNTWRKSTYYHYYEYPDNHRVLPHFGIRTDQYKLIGFYDTTIHWELYDLKSDPDEMKNLYDQPGQTTRIKGLKEELKKLMVQYKDVDALKLLVGKS
ncbi:MAG: sulfatase [Saprospiraceae bacterium]